MCNDLNSEKVRWRKGGRERERIYMKSEAGFFPLILSGHSGFGRMGIGRSRDEKLGFQN